MSSVAKTHYTPEEYLALEREAEYKSEFINGQIYPMKSSGSGVYAMAGASREHNLIAGNVFGELRMQLKGRLCEAYVNDMRVKINPTGMYTYPDVVAVCDKPLFEDEHGDSLLNPAVIIEVLSPSTEAYDRGEKFAHYRRLASLTDYVLVSQDKVRLEHYTRQSGGDQWILTEISGLDSVLHLASIDCELALRDVYEKITISEGLGLAP